MSTIAELDDIVPVLHEFKASGRTINVLYGIPLPPSQVDRLVDLGRQLGPDSISILVDHASQLDGASRFSEKAGFPAGVYIKVDTGYHRAGLPPSGVNKGNLIAKLMELETRQVATFVGLYSHSSLSYNDTTPAKAMANLEGEIHGCLDALQKNADLFPKDKQIIISVGASPQVTSVENLVGSTTALSGERAHLRNTIQTVTQDTSSGFRTRLELHAGVYSVLDVQQLSTRSRVQIGDYEDEIAVSVAAEVCSVYNGGERRRPEALAAVGVLGLGREPCVAYKGWGVVGREAYAAAETAPERRLIVERVSQEHCIISWNQDGEASSAQEPEPEPPIPLEVGQSIRIFPNHACITGALYGWYLVVDSSEGVERDATRIVDVWTRASGW